MASPISPGLFAAFATHVALGVKAIGSYEKYVPGLPTSAKNKLPAMATLLKICLLNPAALFTENVLPLSVIRERFVSWFRNMFVPSVVGGFTVLVHPADAVFGLELLQPP